MNDIPIWEHFTLCTIYWTEMVWRLKSCFHKQVTIN
jgi:hypothetical protein